MNSNDRRQQTRLFQEARYFWAIAFRGDRQFVGVVDSAERDAATGQFVAALSFGSARLRNISGAQLEGRSLVAAIGATTGYIDAPPPK